MKRYQTKDKSLYVLLIKNYVVFTLVMAILMLVLYFAEGWAERRILQPPRRNGALGGQNLLLSGEFEKLSMEKLLGTSGYFEILDKEQQLIYSDTEEQRTYTPKEISYIPAYGTSLTYEATEYSTKDNEKQILITCKRHEWDTGYEDNVSYMILNEKYQVISTTADTDIRQFSKIELDYLTGKDRTGYEICKYEYTGNDGEKYTLLMHIKGMDRQRYRQLLSLWRIFIPLYIAVYVIITIGFTVYIHRKVKEPLDLLNEGILNFAEGERETELSYRGPKEFETIFSSFNKMARQLRESEEAKERLIMEKQRMMADISHDLKTPITVIAGYAKAVFDGLGDPETQKQYLGTIIQKADNLTRQINTFYDYSKLEHPEFALVKKKQDFAEFLRTYLAGRYDEIELAEFRLEVEIPEEQILHSFDEVQFGRVLDNILANALKHNPKGTTIYITLQQTERTIQIEVGDNGVGIPEEIKEQLFDPFTVGDDSRHNRQGSGLGLAVAAKIVELHGGALFLEKAGNGYISTLFVIRLMKEK